MKLTRLVPSALFVAAFGLAVFAQTKKTAEQQTRDEIASYEKQLEPNHPFADLIKFNMAQGYFALDSAQKASEIYGSVAKTLPAEYKSMAYNNSGVTTATASDLKSALEQFKAALKADPKNETARFNYELTKRRILEQKPPPPPEEQPDQSDPPPLNPKPIESLGQKAPYESVSLEEARKILQEQKKREKQFIQQLRKHSIHDERYSREPNW